MKISGVYKITNTITGDFYIGSSKDVKQRWIQHKKSSVWKYYPNNPIYHDMRKYGTDKFEFQILEEVEIGSLKEKEQWFIETLKPTYNNRRANGLDVERKKEYNKEYKKSDKYKEYNKEYKKSDKYNEYQKEYQKEYHKTDKNKDYHKKYYNQLCYYNGETLTLRALSLRFYKAGIENPTKESKKYLIKKEPENVIEFYDVYP